MWNKEKATRLVGIVTKEYGKEIIAEGSKAVMGLEDYIDRIIAEILEIDSNIVTVAREWRKVIERVAMTEGIDKVKIVLEQEIQDTAAGKEELVIQEGESKSDIEMLYQTNSSKTDDSIVEIEVIPEEDCILTLEKSKEDYSIMEDVKEIQEIETT